MSQNHNETKPLPPSFREAFRFWLKLGCISFGGPAGQIAIMHQELVEKRRWISERRFLHALNYCMLLPGPEAQQLATYIGWLLHGVRGGLAAGILFVLPSFFLLVLLSWIYVTFAHLPVVAGIFYGIKPAVTAIVLQATYRIGMRTLKNPALWGIACCSFLGLFLLGLPFPLIVLLAALAGLFGGRVAPALFSGAGHAKGAQADYGPAVISDDSGPHARFSFMSLFKVLALGLILWLVPLVILIFWGGWEHPYTQMGWFFTKAAFLTFGGAYAVLPYVFQAAVEHYHWLSAPQMIDGLALGETTPGPLIIVLAFVGFVGGYGAAPFGPEWMSLAGIMGAAVVTWFTFLPSFLFIFAGAPIVEATHGKMKFTAPLTAITAAVVGVIFNLALFFGYHVLWPQGFAGAFDGFAFVMMVLAALALLAFKRSVLSVIGVSALVGLVFSLSVTF